MMRPSSTIQHLQSVPNGLVWKHSSSLLTTHSSSSTVTSSYVTQPSQATSAPRNVLKVAVEGVTQVLRWLMMCTLWSRAPSTSNERNESKRSAVLWIKTVSEIVVFIIGYYLLSFLMELFSVLPVRRNFMSCYFRSYNICDMGSILLTFIEHKCITCFPYLEPSSLNT